MQHSIIQTRSQKLNSKMSINKLSPDNLKTSIKEKWLHDIYLDAYFESFSSDILKSRSDILLLGPSSSQLLKCGSSYQVLETATSLSLDSFNYIFFCVNDSVETENCNTAPKSKYTMKANGCHWSLLFLNRLKETFFHFDSVKGLNKKHAFNLAHNVAPSYRISEIETLQQIGSYECGIHVIVNTRILLNRLTNLKIDNFDQCVSSNDNVQENVIVDSLNLFYNHNNSLKSRTKQENHKTTNTTPHSFKEKKSNYIKVKVSKKNISQKCKTRVNNFKISCSNSFEVLSSKNSIEEEYLDNTNMTTNNTSKFLNPTHKIHRITKKTDPCNNVNSINSLCETHLNQIHIIGDSHSRGLANILRQESPTLQVTANVYPGAPLDFLMTKIMESSTNYKTNDALLIIGGTNDISKNNYTIDNIKFKLKIIKLLCPRTRVYILDVPYRYDKSYLNKYIRNVNKLICQEVESCQSPYFENINLNKIRRKHYTKHGLHLTDNGKHELSKIIIEKISYKQRLPNTPILTSQHPTTTNVHKNTSNISSPATSGTYQWKTYSEALVTQPQSYGEDSRSHLLKTSFKESSEKELHLPEKEMEKISLHLLDTNINIQNSQKNQKNYVNHK